MKTNHNPSRWARLKRKAQKAQAEAEQYRQALTVAQSRALIFEERAERLKAMVERQAENINDLLQINGRLMMLSGFPVKNNGNTTGV